MERFAGESIRLAVFINNEVVFLDGEGEFRNVKDFVEEIPQIPTKGRQPDSFWTILVFEESAQKGFNFSFGLHVRWYSLGLPPRATGLFIEVLGQLNRSILVAAAGAV